MENSKIPEDEKKFKEEIWKELDIKLEKMGHNPGMRAVAKLCLNSLWGKFAQRTNLPTTEFVDNYEDFWNIIDNDSFESVDKIYENEDICMLSYTQNVFFENKRNDTNIFIAEFTTCWARLKLYQYLDILGEQVVGFDTDSIWYLKGEKSIETFKGKLGEMESELGEGIYIVYFVSTGPKSYIYIDSEGNIVCKNKGFRINFRNSEKINFESMLQLVKKEIDEIITVNEKKITRDSIGKIINVVEEKRLKLTCSKRVYLKNYDSIPYGY